MIMELMGVKETLISPDTRHRGTITPPVTDGLAKSGAG
jgi:hypothetical protein